MEVQYPPLSAAKLAKLKLELRLIPYRHREDALQEAWLAHLERRNAAHAVKSFARRERKHEQREIPFSQLNDEQCEELKRSLELQRMNKYEN